MFQVVSQDPTDKPPAGQTFGRYVLLECIGKGGMAEVFRAVSHGAEGFQRVFVVKRILKEKSASPAFVEMFINEARISALLNHPNIVQVYDFGQIEGSFFLSMEHLRGKDLLTLLRELRVQNRSMPPEVAAYIVQQVALGLHFAHTLKQHGGKTFSIVHRDVSPSNVMLLRAGGVKLLDFGIAKADNPADPKGGGTQSGTVKGKLSYLSPEQVRNETLDGRSDIFSLGVVLWECLTGKRLFYDKTDYQTMKNVLERPVPPPATQRFDLPPQLDYIAVRALERDLTQRYPSAKAMADDIESYLQQSHFSPSALPRLLDELFGEDHQEVEDQLPPIEPQLEVSAALILQHQLTSGSSSSVRPVEIGPVISHPSLSGRRGMMGGSAARPRGRNIAAGVGVAVVLAAGVMLFLRPGPVTTAGDNPFYARLRGRVGRAIAHVPGLRPKDPKADVEKTALAALVSIHLQTDPRGAEVRGPNDTMLGISPTTAQFPRSSDPVVLTFLKPGFSPARHSIVPDRDVTALITLRLAPRGKAPLPTPARMGLRVEPEAASPAVPEASSDIKLITDDKTAPATDPTAPPPIGKKTAPAPADDTPPQDPFAKTAK